MPAGLNYASNLLHGNGSLMKEFGSIAKMSIRKKTGGGNATLVELSMARWSVFHGKTRENVGWCCQVVLFAA
jgi:hypothetical protein